MLRICNYLYVFTVCFSGKKGGFVAFFVGGGGSVSMQECCYNGITDVLNVHYDMHCPWTSISLTVLSDPGSEYGEDFSPQDEFL